MSGELKIVVFGASSGGCFALKRLPKSYEPIAFADNDVNKQGERMLGLPILSAESALDLGPDRIVVASMYAEEISQQLIALGYSSELIEQVETVRTKGVWLLPRRLVKRLLGYVGEIVWGLKSIASSHDPFVHNEQVMSNVGFKTTNRECLRILITGGYGYGNVGDEAQLSACITRWKTVDRNCHVSVFTPNPEYTDALHDAEAIEWAPRVAWFRANTIGPYDDSRRFRWFFHLLRIRVLVSAWAMKRHLPFSLCRSYEQRILQLVMDHNLLHVSGGGFMTGMTRSRLWENSLLMNVCQVLGTPYMLTGQTIGVFGCKSDKRICRKGLKKACHIGLRDRGVSEEALKKIGIHGTHVVSGCDDALLGEKLSKESVCESLSGAGVSLTEPFVVINFHEWGQSEGEKAQILGRFGELCDHVAGRGFRLVAIAMTPSDVESIRLLRGTIESDLHVLEYSPNYRFVRGAIALSSFVLTMKHHPVIFAQGEGVPVLAVALDDYYYHKNLGALRNLRQDKNLLSKENFYSNSAISKIDQLIDETAEDSVEALDHFRAQEFQPYRAFIDTRPMGS